MTEWELLEEVKSMTPYTGDYHNKFLMRWIKEAKEMLKDSGVNEETIESERSVGVITQIVLDLTENGGVTNGTKERIAQLALTYPRGANNG